MVSRSVLSFVFLFSLVFSVLLPSASAAFPSKFDPMYKFAKEYAAALTECDNKKIASFYDESYTAYEADGEIYNKPGLVKALAGFCETYSAAKFELLDFKRASWDQLYAVMKMKYDGFKDKEIIYSHSFTIKYRFGKTTIVYDLRGINGDIIKANLV